MIGQTISHYKILEKLGGGGMGVVYKALDTNLKRTVALKFLPSEVTGEKMARERFLHEAQAASTLEHSNICTIHEIEETADGEIFIAMSYCEGQSLKEKIQRGPLELQEAISVATQIGHGLACAHSAEIVHRDIKPANIIVSSQGIVKIVDFGLAKLAGRSTLTQFGTTVGTIAYMSPEQARGGPVDLRSDIWSLGVVLYEMISGQLPFRSEYEQAIIYSILNADPEPPSHWREDVSQDIEKIIQKCLQKDPTHRYQTLPELLDDLGRVTQGRPVQAEPARTADTERVSIPSRRLLTVVISAALLITVLVLIVFLPPVREQFQEWIGGVIIPQEKHIAILPFVNVGDDPGGRAFCDGLVETLTSKLTQLQPVGSDVWVVAASEVRQRNIQSVGEARKMFGVTLGITGSVQREPDRVRLTFNLVDAKTSRQISSAVTDERNLTLSALEDKVLRKLADMLQLKVQPQSLLSVSAGQTPSARAYDHYVQGRGYLQRADKIENIIMATSAFKEALQADSTYALAYAGLGQASWHRFELSKEKKWIEDATNNCQRAASLDNRLSPVHVTLGLISKGTGRYEEAVQEFQKALDLDPFNDDAHRGLATAYESLGDISMSEETYKKAIELRPTYWAGYNSLGVFYYRHGRNAEAISQFRKVVELTPDNFRGYNNLGGIYFYMNRWDEAERMFRGSVRIEPNYVGYSQLGTLLYYREKYDEAVKAFEEAVKIQSHYHRIWANLASAYYGKLPSDSSKWVETYNKAIQVAEEQRRLNPRDSRLLCDLAEYYAAVNRKDEARKLVGEAIALASDDVVILGRAGATYESLGMRDEALTWIKIALKKGYSPVELEGNHFLKDLRADSRYIAMMKEHKK